MEKYILAIDSFKGCLTSTEAEQAACEGILAVQPDATVVSLPVSDGGDGMLSAFSAALKAKKVEAHTHDNLLRYITGQYAISGTTAVIEVAQACGLNLIKPEERNPLIATSYGVGELIIDAMKRGCKKFIIGLGGSGTSDCGLGMLQAFVDKFPRKKTGNAYVYHPKSWDDVSYVFRDLEFILASDVDNPLYGPDGAAYVFGPQKGANQDQVKLLDRRAQTFAEMSARHFGYDRSREKGAGAAGGLGYAFLEYLNAKVMSGANLLLDLLHFDDLLAGADLVVTGEGKADRQTVMGKLPYVILQRSMRQGIPVALVAGQVADPAVLSRAGFRTIVCINPEGTRSEEALRPEIAKKRMSTTVSRLVSGDIM